jgi:hypothetical protein
MRPIRKSNATDRTVDIFSGKSREDEAQAEAEDVKEAPRLSENIEQAADRWRANAMFTAEHFSKHYDSSEPEIETFRLTSKDGNMFLEKFSSDKKGKAYHWSGVMFREDSLYELTNVFVKAAKSKRDRERLGISGEESSNGQG